MLRELEISKARAGKKPRKLTDGKGLYLEVRPSGAKLWRYRYRINGKENVFALGEYAASPAGETEPQRQARMAGRHFTLVEAREELHRARRLVKQGIHPSHQRKSQQTAQIADNANTFQAVALEWIERRKTGKGGKRAWSSSYIWNVEHYMETEVFPRLGSLPIRAVTPQDVLAVLNRLEDRPTVAYLTRQWCSAVFRHAIANLRAEVDPTMALRDAVGQPEPEHKKPLESIGQFMKDLNKATSTDQVKLCLALLLLTFVRPGEIRAAEWTEFDFEAREWRIPAARMKMREMHIVPLSDQAMALLKELHALTGYSNWLFPNTRRPKACMSKTTLNRAISRMGYGGKFSAHGFRATASTKLNEKGFRTDVIERQLAHKERNRTRASYNQAEYLEERRQLMQSWADLVYGIADDNVVPIRRNAA